LAGIRVLVVEDEALVLLSLEDMLTELGCDVVVAMRVDDALAKASALTFDVALLDVNVAGRRVDPVAELLARRGIPFILSTGYEDVSGLQLPGARATLNKPYLSENLKAALRTALGSAIAQVGDAGS
jgi:CheY-like chemotaxis protein